VVSALVLAPPHRPLSRRRVAAVLGCLVATWELADLGVTLIRSTI
jgi:hypothetical protein